MDFDRADYNPYSLAGLGGSAGMNDISALAAAASDQLYELERHEAFRRAEYELRHRQIAGARKSNGNSPSGTPGANLGSAYGFSNSSERDRFSIHGIPAPGGGQMVYPLSAAQPATANHPAVPAGTLADPTYLVPPTCCHEECHKSYRKRLKVAKQTQACPNCLTMVHGSNSFGGHGGGAGHGPGGGSGGDSHHSSNSNTPKDGRSNMGSHDDLTKLGNGGGGSLGNSYNLHHHHAQISQQLARLQQQHQLALQKARQQSQMAGAGAGPSRHLKPYTLDLHAHRGLIPSTQVSAAPSPASSDSEDDDEAMVGNASFESFLPATSPVLSGMRHMSLFQQGKAMTAPASAVTSPVHSRNPSRAGSPVEGHSANSGKHGHGSHRAHDAKTRSHPYTHFSATTPNSPHFPPTKSRGMSPPKLARTLSNSHGVSSSSHHSSAGARQSVEDILNAHAIPPPPPPSDRTLPPPNSSASFTSSVPSVSYSLSSQPTSAHASPATSRAGSPVHSTHSTNPAHASHHHLAHSVRAAFGMTPMGMAMAGGGGGAGGVASSISPKSGVISPPRRLAPMNGGDGVKHLPSFSRGTSPVMMGMDVDPAA